jgi:hypothetical protein
MKLNLKTVCVSVAFCGVLFSAGAQINLLSNDITFRTYNNASHETVHYGSLYLNSGSNGQGSLTCSGINNQGMLLNWGTFLCFAPASFSNGLTVYGGTKDFLHPHPTDTTKAIKYICIEAGESMTMVRGVSKTSGGSVEILLPEHFGLVTSASVPVTVLITPEDAPVLLYTSKKTKESITVVMKPADFKEFGDAQFAWQVSGARDGYENEEIIVDAESYLSGKRRTGTVSESREKINKWVEKQVTKQKMMANKGKN